MALSFVLPGGANMQVIRLLSDLPRSLVSSYPYHTAERNLGSRTTAIGLEAEDEIDAVALSPSLYLLRRGARALPQDFWTTGILA